MSSPIARTIDRPVDDDASFQLVDDRFSDAYGNIHYAHHENNPTLVGILTGLDHERGAHVKWRRKV
jgi:hypothetical protein